MIMTKWLGYVIRIVLSGYNRVVARISKKGLIQLMFDLQL